MEALTLNKAIEQISDGSFDYTDSFKTKQLTNWLKQLKHYHNRDDAMKVTHVSLSGKELCPRCGELMQIGVKNFCDKCGQAIER